MRHGRLFALILIPVLLVLAGLVANELSKR